MRLPLALLLLALPLIGQDTASQSSAVADNKNVSGSVDLGYRGVSDVAGSVDTYRSVVNLNDGFRMLGLDLFLKDPNRKLFDQLTIYADDWGDPYNSFHVDAERNKNYRLLFDYRNIAYFNALPSFANPKLDDGILASQRTFDVRRKIWNGELEFRPGSRIVPYIGFARDSGDGHGVTNFVSTINEYPVSTRFRDSTNNYRGGVRFEFNRWHLSVEQGGTTFKDDQDVSTGDRNPGNRTTPFLGRDLFIDSVRQGYGIRGDSTYSRAVFTASPARWVNFSGNFLYSLPDVDVNYSEDASGLLYLDTQFADETRALGIGTANQPRTSGSFSAEFRPHGRVRILETIMTDRIHTASSLKWNYSALSNSVAAAGSQFFSDRLIRNYNRQQLDGFVDVSRKLTLRGGYRYEWGDAVGRPGTLNPAGQPESGELKRNVGILGANLRVNRKVVFNADYEGSGGNESYFRTSLHDYHQFRARSRIHLRDSLQANVGFLYFSNDNPASGNDYDFRNLSATGSLRWSPSEAKRISVLGEYTYSSLKSDIAVRVPPFFLIENSRYRDIAHSATGLVDINLPPIGDQAGAKISVGGSMFRSGGSRPTKYWQPVARFLLPVHRHVAGFAEWRYYGMTQNLYSFEGFRTHTVTVGLKFTL